MQVCTWMVFLLLICGIRFLKYYMFFKTNQFSETYARRSNLENASTQERRNTSTKTILNCPVWRSRFHKRKTFHFGALLYIFEDNEAVIKIIFPKTEVRRPEPPVLAGPFFWIFLDPKIQIKYVDTKKQLADMSTKDSNFNRNEWNHVLCFNVVSKRFGPKEYERVVAREIWSLWLSIELQQCQVRAHLKIRGILK